MHLASLLYSPNENDLRERGRTRHIPNYWYAKNIVMEMLMMFICRLLGPLLCVDKTLFYVYMMRKEREREREKEKKW